MKSLFDGISKLASAGAWLYKGFVGGGSKVEQPNEFKKILKDSFKTSEDKDVVEIREKWKKIKEEADISTHEKFEELIAFLNEVHGKAENELDTEKYQITKSAREFAEKVDYKGAIKQYTSKYESVKSSLKKFQNGLMDKMNGLRSSEIAKWQEECAKLKEKYAKLQEELAKAKGEEPPAAKAKKESDESNIYKEKLLVIFGKVRKELEAVQSVIKQYLGEKYEQALSSSGGKDTQSIVKKFPCLAAYLRIIASVAGVSSKENGESSSKTKDYTKYFGKGFLAKAVYNSFAPYVNDLVKPEA